MCGKSPPDVWFGHLWLRLVVEPPFDSGIAPGPFTRTLLSCAVTYLCRGQRSMYLYCIIHAGDTEYYIQALKVGSRKVPNQRLIRREG